jgi:phosphoglycerate dehydrogenase-like enzyme
MEPADGNDFGIIGAGRIGRAMVAADLVAPARVVKAANTSAAPLASVNLLRLP